MLLILLILILVFGFGGYGYGYSRYGGASFGPVGLIIIIALVLYLTGNLH